MSEHSQKCPKCGAPAVWREHDSVIVGGAFDGIPVGGGWKYTPARPDVAVLCTEWQQIKQYYAGDMELLRLVDALLAALEVGQ